MGEFRSFLEKVDAPGFTGGGFDWGSVAPIKSQKRTMPPRAPKPEPQVPEESHEWNLVTATERLLHQAMLQVNSGLFEDAKKKSEEAEEKLGAIASAMADEPKPSIFVRAFKRLKEMFDQLKNKLAELAGKVNDLKFAYTNAPKMYPHPDFTPSRTRRRPVHALA